MSKLSAPIAYLSGVLVGTAMSYEAPHALVHNYYVYAIGALLYLVALIWRKG